MESEYLNGKTFLIVDDDKFNIQLIETMLEKIADVRVVSTDKGSEALSVLRTCDGYIDMVLLDLHMNEMGADDFVLKPFDLDDLKAKILKHLPGKV